VGSNLISTPDGNGVKAIPRLIYVPSHGSLNKEKKKKFLVTK